MQYPSDFLILSPDSYLKQLEDPCVYNIATDELYETNSDAFEFLKLCDGTKRNTELKCEKELLDWCLKEGILSFTSDGLRRDFILEPAPVPSLRYLELQITARCNLKCGHCYLGEAKNKDLPLDEIINILTEFERIQGLRLLISGGEPLLHPDFWSINDALYRFGFRSVLLSNGTLIDQRAAEWLEVQEVQISLDGVEEAHDVLRGKGTYAKAITAIKELQRAGKAVSVATMVHAGNLQDFVALKELLQQLGVTEWNIDVPCITGNLADHPEIQVPHREAAEFLKYSTGGGLYTSAHGYACGAHLCAIMSGGEVVKCGFFADSPVGYIREGLRACWERMEHITLDELECDCPYTEECRGGCRFRAMIEKDIYSPDPVQCYFRGAEQDWA